MTTHAELFTWACEQCNDMGSEGRLTRKEAAEDGQAHFSFHLGEALERAKLNGNMERQHVGLVRVIPIPASTNTEVL